MELYKTIYTSKDFLKIETILQHGLKNYKLFFYLCWKKNLHFFLLMLQWSLHRISSGAGIFPEGSAFMRMPFQHIFTLITESEVQ